MKTAIVETKDYGKFEMLGFNRDVKKTNSLEESMKKHGWIPAYPMHVVQNGKDRLKIKAGHHRFYVARKLGVPVQFVVCDDTASIFELESATNPWNLNDFLASNIRDGKGDYQKVQEYCRRTGITLRDALSLLGGNITTSMEEVKWFKEGTYVLGWDMDIIHAEEVGDIVVCMKEAGVTWAATHLLVQAISKALCVNNFDPGFMKNQIKKYSDLLTKKSSVYDYLYMLVALYNHANPRPIWLVSDIIDVTEPKVLVRHK